MTTEVELCYKQFSKVFLEIEANFDDNLAELALLTEWVYVKSNIQIYMYPVEKKTLLLECQIDVMSIN